MDRHEVAALLLTIAGIGKTSAARLVTGFGEIDRFASGEAAAAFVGAVPTVSQSGNRQSQPGQTTPIGDGHLRAKLWMPTLVAIKHNPWLRAFYERLAARGKLPTVAITAVMRKLLMAVYSVAKNRRPFAPLRPVAAATGR